MSGAGTSATGAVRTEELLPTALLGERGTREVRDLMDASFDYTDQDWDHASGGVHALVRLDGVLVAHGALVQRRLLVAGRSLRCGYVGSVAVADGHRGEQLGAAIMSLLESLAPSHDVLGLKAHPPVQGFYRARGWQQWRGPTAVLTPEGPLRTPDDDGTVLVLGGQGLDLAAPVACEWRDGDLW